MILIVDYQMGNLRSVQKALEKAGHQALVSSNPADLAQAEKIVLPGVGAMPEALDELRRRELVEPIRQAISAGKPFLGICLGLQMLFETGHEEGRHAGLGIVPGEVVPLKLPAEYKVPHMGWNQIQIVNRPPILEGIAEGAYFYFAHSSYVVPQEPQLIATQTEHGPKFCSMIWRDNLFATQFHPEKSQTNGLRLLKNFAEL